MKIILSSRILLSSHIKLYCHVHLIKVIICSELIRQGQQWKEG